jgi:hypothetical protein
MDSDDVYAIAKKQGFKFNYKIANRRIRYYAEKPVLSINYEFYRSMLVHARKDYLIEQYALDDYIYDYDYISKLSNKAFISGSTDYQYLVGMTQLYGWKKDFSDINTKDKLKAWVNNDWKPNYNGSEDTFNEKFRNNVRKVLRWKAGNLSAQTNARDFCSNIASTSTSGSAYDPGGPVTRIYDDGTPIYLERNKFSKSGALTTMQKLKRLFKYEKQKANVSYKVEPFPKVRTIVSSDYNLFLRMQFISTWLDTWMEGNDKSTLWQTKDQTYKMWSEFSHNEDDTYNIPIDQSAFDHHVTKTMVMIMLEEVRNLIRDRCNDNEEYIDVMDRIIYAMDGGSVIYKSNDEVISMTYESGILSGWRWTAFLDTLANIAECETAFELCNENEIPIEVVQFNAQGDDVLLRVKSLKQSVAVVSALRAMGFEVHPNKTFYSTHHNEYLRKYSKDDEVNGYPARLINKMLWLYPGKQEVTDKVGRMSAIVTNWTRLKERLRTIKDGVVKSLMYRDLRRTKISSHIIQAYISTDRLFGGAGLESGRNKIINKTAKELVGRVTIDAPGYDEFKDKYGKYQEREMKDWFLRVTKAQVDYTGEDIIISDAPEIKPLRYRILPSMSKPTPYRDKRFPLNVIFGKSRDLLSIPYPNIDTFAERGRCPKSWIYSYLAGQIDTVTAEIPRMSLEFASLLQNRYEASIINAMYYKTTTNNKWLRLQKYKLEYMPLYLSSLDKPYPTMF